MATDRKKIEEIRQRQHVEMMSFSRYLLFRYVITFFFFVDFYWIILLLQAHQVTWLVPFILMLASFPAMWEHFKKLHDLSNKLQRSKIYFWVQAGANAILAVICLSPAYSSLFPFMHLNEKAFVIGILLLGIMICLIMERKVYLIERNQDKYYTHLKKAKEAAQTNIEKLYK